MKPIAISCSLLLAVTLAAAPAAGENWLGFRGPDGSGISSDKAPPVKWSDSENLKWKTPLPGPGSSSPIVWGDRVFVWVNESGVVYCLSAKTGKRVYREKLTRPGGSTIPTRSVYASIVKIAGNFYAISRKHGTFIIAADLKFRQIAVNQLNSDTSDFNASPAISDGRIFIRSNRFIYYIQNKGASIALTSPTFAVIGDLGGFAEKFRV